MAASNLGASNMPVVSLKFSHKPELYSLFRDGVQVRSRLKAWKCGGLRSIRVSQNSYKALTLCQSRSSLVTENESTSSRIEEVGEQKSFPNPISELIPNSNEVKFLLTELCDTTSIAEFELKLNGFQLHVTRALSGGNDPPPWPPSPSGSASVRAHTASEVLAVNGSASATSLAIIKAGPSEGDPGTILERAADEGFVIIQSPKVGFFRRSRTIKGKRAPPSCKEKQVVKEGQVICYIEQLGGEIPLESDVSGEVVKILRKDGEAVGYGDAIISILPSFPGIKKLSS